MGSWLSARLVVHTVVDCDVANKIPQRFVDSIIWERYDKYWTVVVVGPLFAPLFTASQEPLSQTLEQVAAAIGIARKKVKQTGKQPTTLLDIDANITLPANVSGITGPATAVAQGQHATQDATANSRQAATASAADNAKQTVAVNS